jgi:hypothetical protein
LLGAADVIVSLVEKKKKELAEDKLGLDGRVT